MHRFGYGDVWPPDPSAVLLLEKLAMDYIKDVTAKALRAADLSTSGKLDKECFLTQIRKDRRKSARIAQLLHANDDLKRVQKLEMREDAV